MIPVEDAAGGAAFVLHNEPKRAPDQHADQIAHIEESREQYHNPMVNHAREKKGGDECAYRDPNEHDLVCGGGGIFHILLEILDVYFLFDRTKERLEHFLRSDGDMRFDRDESQDHVIHPNPPKQVQRRKIGEEFTLGNVECIAVGTVECDCDHKDQYPAKQAQKINFSCL